MLLSAVFVGWLASRLSRQALDIIFLIVKQCQRRGRDEWKRSAEVHPVPWYRAVCDVPIPIFDSVRHDVHSLSSSMYHIECYYFNLHGDILCLSMGSDYCDGLVIVKEMGI